MDEVNPLEIDLSQTITTGSKSYERNGSGRPPAAKMITFTQQPKSIIISQILKDIKTEELFMTNKNIEDCLDIDISKEKRCDKPKKCKEPRFKVPHKKEYFCDYVDCSYKCKYSSNLIKHKRRHTAEKPYICDKCTFRSNFVNSLKAHKRIHTSERPYSCKHCAHRCNSSSNLKRHCQYRHTEVKVNSDDS